MARLKIADLQTQIAELTARLAALEAKPRPAPEMKESISEAEMLAISAALGAYLGVRAHIRQIRLIGGGAWAQQGRVSIQASHRLTIE